MSCPKAWEAMSKEGAMDMWGEVIERMPAK